ncbi:ABC transporter permease subunit [Tissierella sp. MB52-C2]|uniref:ABC transporter permease n=1 Tax=Tissierella sp. MB52-C2 TaxID=3070999 RepID=UPI00280A50AD|nr:ABC transporter permease subunit [Tissierella sp. MB52-C2]WMM25908.1 ABC transporter permease subunit [Tissierella sp. MB52-C2]
MKALVYNEIKLFFSKKNVFLMLLAILSVLLIFQFYYVKLYKEYPSVKMEELQSEINNATVWYERYSNQLETLYNESPEHESISSLEFMADVWSVNLNNLNFLKILWENSHKNELKIQEVNQKLDNNLVRVFEQKIDVRGSNLYRTNERDWNKRMLLMKEYGKDEQLPEINPNRPDGFYIINQAINGESPFSLVFIFLFILLNYDIWSLDFENETIRLIFTLPFSKKRIYLTRFFSRFILSLCAVVLCLIVLFFLGNIQFGLGLDRYGIINEKAVQTFGFFETSGDMFFSSDKVVSMLGITMYTFTVFVAYIFLIYSLVQLVSYISKNQMISFLLPLTGLITLMTYLLLPRDTHNVGYNVFLYLQTQKLFDGSLGIGLLLALFILILSSLLMFAISMFTLMKREQ